MWSELQAYPTKIKTTRISSEGSEGISAKICTHENFPLYGSWQNTMSLSEMWSSQTLEPSDEDQKLVEMSDSEQVLKETCPAEYSSLQEKDVSSTIAFRHCPFLIFADMYILTISFVSLEDVPMYNCIKVRDHSRALTYGHIPGPLAFQHATLET